MSSEIYKIGFWSALVTTVFAIIYVIPQPKKKLDTMNAIYIIIGLLVKQVLIYL